MLFLSLLFFIFICQVINKLCTKKTCDQILSKYLLIKKLMTVCRIQDNRVWRQFYFKEVRSSYPQEQWMVKSRSGICAKPIPILNRTQCHFILFLTLDKEYENMVGCKSTYEPSAYPGFYRMKWLGLFLLSPGWDASPSQGYPPAFKFTGAHLYTWVERGTVRVKSLAQEHNIMSQARVWTWTAISRV